MTTAHIYLQGGPHDGRVIEVDAPQNLPRMVVRVKGVPYFRVPLTRQMHEGEAWEYRALWDQ